MTKLATAEVDLVAGVAKFRKDMSGAAQHFQNVGQSMQRMGRTLSTRVTLPLAALGAASIKMAVDAEESANKFNVVMGGAADEVRERFAKLEDTIPLTTARMENLAAGVQDLLVPLGLARDQAAGMSADMVELAGDLASFNNVAADQALEAIKSALAGSSEPMRRFGVDTRETRLQTLALNEGLIQQGQALDGAARGQAVLLAIQRDSADAMGDAARTADSAANSIRFLVRDAKELAQSIGEILIPVVIPLVQKLNDMLRFLRDLSPEMQKMTVAVFALSAAIGPLLFFLGGMIRSLSAIALLVSPGAVLAVGIAALVTLIGVRYVKAASEAAKQTRELKTAAEEMGVALRTMSVEAARVTFAQLQRATLDAMANVERIKEELRSLPEEMRTGPSGEELLRSPELDAAMARVQELQTLLHEARVAFFEMSEGAKTSGEQSSEATNQITVAVRNLNTELVGVASAMGGLRDVSTGYVTAAGESSAATEELIGWQHELASVVSSSTARISADFSAMARAIIADMLRVIQRLLVMRAMMAILSPFAGGGGFLGALSSAFSAPFASAATAGMAPPTAVTPSIAPLSLSFSVSGNDPVARIRSAEERRAFSEAMRQWMDSGGRLG